MIEKFESFKIEKPEPPAVETKKKSRRDLPGRKIETGKPGISPSDQERVELLKKEILASTNFDDPGFTRAKPQGESPENSAVKRKNIPEGPFWEKLNEIWRD